MIESQLDFTDFNNSTQICNFEAISQFNRLFNRWLKTKKYEDDDLIPARIFLIENGEHKGDNSLNILTRAVKSTENELAGFEFGMHLGSQSYGVFGYAVQHSSNIREALNIIENYFNPYCPIYTVYTTIGNEFLSLHYDWSPFSDNNDDSEIVGNFFTLYFLGFVTTLLQETVTARNVNIHVRLSIPEPGTWNNLIHLPNYHFYFDCDFNSLQFPLECLDATMEHPDSVTTNLLRIFFDRQFTPSTINNDLIKKIKRIIFDYPQGTPSHEYVAHQLRMSPRTLRRKLKKQNTTYKTILDQVRMKKAIDLLTNTNFRLYQISKMIGFKNISNFRKAFKKWTGNNFNEYR